MADANIILNPLTHSTDTISIFDLYTEEEIDITKFNISKYFKYIFVLCPIYGNIDESIFKENIDKKVLNDILKKCVLYKTSIRIVKNDNHYNNTLYISKDIINMSNIYNYELTDNVLVLPILNISFLHLQKYLDNFEEKNDVEQLYNLIVINDYFCNDSMNNYKSSSYLEKLIKTLDESTYWTTSFNCKLNMTQEFKNRKFNLKRLINVDNDIYKLLKDLENAQGQDNYIEEIFKYKKYVDPSSIINKKGYRLYNIESNIKFTKDHIYHLLLKLNKESGFMLFCKLLVSKIYSQLVFDVRIFELFTDYINHYMYLIKHLFSYSWIKLYMEESIKRSRLKESDDIVFTIDMASKLPVFPVEPENPYTNPYLPMMVSYSELNPELNINGVKITDLSDIKRIATLEEFKKRFNIFICGNSQIDLFDGIDFEKNKMAISGSVMTACLQYKHPLMKLFLTNTNSSMDQLFYRFFNEYYCESDIDIMIKTKDYFEFLDISNNIFTKLQTNMYLLTHDFNPEHFKKEIIKNIYVFVKPEFIKENINTPLTYKYLKQNNYDVKQYDYDFIISNLKNVNIKLLFLKYIKLLNEQKINKYLEDFSEEKIQKFRNKYPEFFEEINLDNVTIRLSYDNKGTVENINSTLTLNEEEMEKIFESSEETKDNKKSSNIEVVEFNDIDLLFNFKTKLSCPYLDHDFEIFSIKGDEFFGVVNNFHLPCVRAYYTGKQVYMTPSCISAHLTYMNMNYKYVSGTKDPLEIINKYRMRGFGTYLNKTEIFLYLKYINTHPFWKTLFDINIDNRITFKNAIGNLDINHKLFHPRLYNAEYYNNKNHIRFLCLDDPNLYNYIEKKTALLHKDNFMKKTFDAIKLYNIPPTSMSIATGYIIPLKSHIIEYMIKENKQKASKILPQVPNEKVSEKEKDYEEKSINDTYDLEQIIEEACKDENIQIDNVTDVIV